MIGGAFATVLRANRADFNTRFAEARRRFPNLDRDVFAGFLEDCAAPMVEAVESARPGQAAEAAYAAYDAALELAGQGLVGAGAPSPAIESGWRDLLPCLAPLVAGRAAGILPAFSNALYHLSRSPGASPDRWIAEMQRLGSLCPDADTLLKAGQVTAWRAGLAHLRQGALDLAATLGTGLALAAVGAPPDSDWPAVAARLSADPWFDPAGTQDDDTFKVAARVGAFRGFGGLFPTPPRVACDGTRFWVGSTGEYWLLAADCFGHTFLRGSAEAFDAAARRNGLPQSLRIKGTTLKYREGVIDLPELGSVGSVAANSHTLAVASPQTHAIVLLALRPHD